MGGVMKEEELIKNIGLELYNKLSEEDRQMILDLSGTITIGRPITAEEINKILDEYKGE
jgi:hypothetical protein